MEGRGFGAPLKSLLYLFGGGMELGEEGAEDGDESNEWGEEKCEEN